MRADANTTATNSGNIRITLDDKSSSDSEGGSSSDSVAVAAGMHAITEQAVKHSDCSENCLKALDEVIGKLASLELSLKREDD